MTSSIENNLTSRREFLRNLSEIALGGALALSGITCVACNPKSREVVAPKLSSEIVTLPVVLDMPFDSEFTVKTFQASDRLNLNKSLTENQIHEFVKKPTAPIIVSLYSDDWLRIQPGNTLLGISDKEFKSLPDDQKNTFKDGLTTTVYDPVSGVPQGVSVHIAVGRFIRESKRGNNMIVQNEFLPKGIVVSPIIVLNTTFYHEVFNHALLRNIDYRKLDQEELAKEELAARKGETKWVMDLVSKGSTVTNDQLFLIPS